MKRTPLLILGSLFLILCIACLFSGDHSNNLLLALIVELFFFVRFAMTKKDRSIPEPQSISNTSQRVEHQEVISSYEVETVAEVQELH